MRSLKSEKLLAEIVSRIEAGAVADGSRLPTHRELAKAKRVSLSVVNRVYSELHRKGLTKPAGRRGTLVQSATPVMAVAAADPKPERRAAEETIDLSHNYAVVPEFNEAIKSLYVAAVMDRWGEANQTIAEERVTTAGRRWMSLIGIELPGLTVTGCAGGQHGILACLLAFVGSGGRIAVDPFTYTGLKLAASALGITLVAVPRDNDGMIPAALERAARDHGISAVYLMPSFHNPFGTAMPAARRKQLAAVSRKKNLFVIEDDPHRYLARDGAPSFLELLPDRCAHVTTMSKILGPQMRLGFVLTAAGNAIRLQLAVRSANWTLPVLEATVVLSAMDSLLPHFVKKLQTIACRRQSLARDHLAAHRIIGDPNAPHLCVTLRRNWKSAQLGYVATTRGLKVSPGITYAADNATESAFEFVRLSLMSEPDEQRLISAFARFDALASASPTAFLDAC